MNQGFEVYHIGIHSFTHQLHGKERNTDVGLLYDPSRNEEKAWAGWWAPLLEMKGLAVRRNYPYFGTSDGFITQMRNKFPSGYAGIELEINQRFVTKQGKFQKHIGQAIVQSIHDLTAIGEQ